MSEEENTLIKKSVKRFKIDQLGLKNLDYTQVNAKYDIIEIV